MTSTNKFFPTSFIGFEGLLNELDRFGKTPNNYYPPHNIIKINDNEFLVQLAVAGFREEDLNVEVQDRTLKISGTWDDSNNPTEKTYVHRGISTKNFQRTFKLSEHVEVIGAELVHGILSVRLEYVLPEQNRARKIDINSQGGQSSAEFLKED